jgi:ATP-binding cassette, subfamily A (ABC1), member 3
LAKQELDGLVLNVSHLRKTFPNGFTAVKDLSVKMYTGQIFALLGHNGAGKTTVISMLTGLLTPTSGEAEVFGLDVFSDITSVREFLGVCPQHNILFDMLTPREHLEIFSDFKGN